MKIKNNENCQSLDEAKTIVIRYLKYRPRTENEIIKKLCEKGFADDLVQQTIEYFKKIGSINDRQFTAIWIQSRLKRPLGIHRIRLELKEKGIGDDIISNALAHATDDYCEHTAVADLAKRRIRQYRHLNALTTKRRLYAYLIRRGFSNDAVIKTLKELNI
jgi:regulatory protein